jgi:hypothetical protein
MNEETITLEELASLIRRYCGFSNFRTSNSFEELIRNFSDELIRDTCEVLDYE